MTSISSMTGGGGSVVALVASSALQKLV